MTHKPLCLYFYFLLTISVFLTAGTSHITIPLDQIGSATKSKAPRIIAEYSPDLRKEIDAQKLSPSNLGNFDPVWKIKGTPKNIRWKHNLKKDEKLVVELQSEGGLPWPTNGILKVGSNTQEFELKPKKKLLKNRHMYVIAHIMDEQGKRKETWLKKIYIN